MILFLFTMSGDSSSAVFLSTKATCRYVATYPAFTSVDANCTGRGALLKGLLFMNFESLKYRFREFIDALSTSYLKPSTLAVSTSDK